MKRLLVVVASIGLLAGCGINPGPVRTEGKPGGPGQLANESELTGDLRRPEGADSAKDLVQRFLKAAADDRADQTQITGSYVKPGEYWRPSPEIRLVRPLSEPTTSSLPDSRTSVQWRVLHVGTLSPKGQILPVVASPEDLKFTVEDVPGKGVYLVAPPQFIYFNETALGEFYQRRLIYFWNAQGDTLVPDLRYVSRYRTEASRADQLVRWLYDGPSEWLDPAVLPPPTETQPGGGRGVTRDANSGALVVDLQTSVGPQEMDRLTKQLVKTLLDSPRLVLDLRVRNQSLGTYSYQPDPPPGPSHGFGIVEGTARRIEGDLSEPVSLPVELNKNLAAVAFSRDETAAMLVHQDGDFVKLSIWSLGRDPVQVNLSPRPRRVSQPIWLADKRSLLVLVDGTLYQVGVEGTVMPVGNGQNLAAVSLNADKTRLALVQGGELKMAALRKVNNVLTVGQPQLVPTQFVKGVQNVTFLGDQQLVVAGANNTEVTLVSMNVDGGAEYSYGGTTFPLSATVGHLVAKQPAGPAYFQVDGRSAAVLQRGTEWVQLQVPAISASPSPSPGSQSSVVLRPSFAG